MSRFGFFTIVLDACLLHPAAAIAWGYQGHELVGAIADQLLKPNAQLQVKNILADGLRFGVPHRGQ